MSAISFGDFFFVGLLSVLAYFFVQYYRKQKLLYEDIDKLHGPYSIPFLGSVHLFLKDKNNAEYIETVERVMEKYPPPMKFRLGPYLFYMTADPEELEIIMRHPAANKKLHHYKILEKPFGQGLLTASGDLWKKNRKLIEPLFNQTKLNDFFPILTEKSTELLENLKERAGKGFFDVQTLVGDCVLSIGLEFGMGMDKQEVDSKIDYKGLIARCSELIYAKIFKPAYQYDIIYKWTASGKEEEEILKKGQRFTDKVINNRRAQLNKTAENQNGTETKETVCGGNKKRTVLLDLLLEKGDFNLKQIRDEVTTFVVAVSFKMACTILIIKKNTNSLLKSYDTSVFVTSITLVLLGMFPQIQEKVYEEVMEIVGPNGNIEHSHLSKLKYLEMTIRESLRIFPTTPFIGRQLEDNVTLKDRILPKGIDVLVPVRYIQRSEKLWPKPHEFIPERFTPEECAKRHPYTFITFGAGTRSCIGMKLAIMEIKTIIATVIRECLIKTNYKSIEEMRLMPNVIYTLRDGFNCSIELRGELQKKT